MTQTAVSLPEVRRVIMAPYLPPAALAEVRGWEKSGKRAFVKAVERDANYAGCKNCAGIGYVFVTLADAGPFRMTPLTRKPLTWFEGDGVSGKGWYIVNRTLEYICPECQARMP